MKKNIKSFWKIKTKRYILTGLASLVLVLIIVVGIASLTLSNSLKNLEKERNRSMELSLETFAVENDFTDKLAKLFGSENISYSEANNLYNDIENITNKGTNLDSDFIKNAEAQKKAFKPIFSFVLMGNKYEKVKQIRESLNVESNNSIDCQKNNLNDKYAVLAITRSMVDMVAIGEALKAPNISEAMQKGAPLQKYTRDGFSFDNESLIKEKNPAAYDAVKQSKSLFSDTYNYLLAVNGGNYEEANRLWSGLGNRIEKTIASIENSFDEKNKEAENFYRTEIESIEKYIDSMNKLYPNFNVAREEAYYTAQSVEYYNYREKKYPRVSDFNGLKELLKLKYGSSDRLRYSALSDNSYTVEFLDKGNWKKLEVKDSSPTNTSGTNEA